MVLTSMVQTRASSATVLASPFQTLNSGSHWGSVGSSMAISRLTVWPRPVMARLSM